LILGEVVLVEFRRVLSGKLKVPADRIQMAEAVFEGIPVATAEAGGADILVTGDEDLLSVAGESVIRIASPRAFWELLH
jgi:hypothetical protein